MLRAVTAFLLLSALRPEPIPETGDGSPVVPPAPLEVFETGSGAFEWFSAVPKASPEAAALWSVLGIETSDAMPPYNQWSAHRGAGGLFVVQHGHNQLWLWEAIEGRLQPLPRTISRLVVDGDRSCLQQSGEFTELWAADAESHGLRSIWRGRPGASIATSPTQTGGLALIELESASGKKTLSLLQPGMRTQNTQVRLQDTLPSGGRWWNNGRILLQAPPKIPEGPRPMMNCGGPGPLAQQVLVYTVKSQSLQPIGEPVVSGWSLAMGCGNRWRSEVLWAVPGDNPPHLGAPMRTVDPDTLKLDQQSPHAEHRRLVH